MPALSDTPVGRVACGWRHTVAVTAAGREVYSWGRGVNGQLGLGGEADEDSPRRLTALCGVAASRTALLAATAAHGGAPPTERYGLVPSAAGTAETDNATVALVPVSDTGENNEDVCAPPAPLPPRKRMHVASSVDDAAVPGS